MWFEEDEDCINYDESPREEEEAKRTYSVDLDCDDGGSCLELAGHTPGDERDVLDGYASRLADEAQLAVWCSQLEAVLEPLDSPRELCSNDSFSGTYPCHC